MNIAENIWTNFFVHIVHIFSLDRTLSDSPFNPTICPNVMIVHQITNLNMKFKYSDNHQIDENHQNSLRIHPFQQVRVKIWLAHRDRVRACTLCCFG